MKDLCAETKNANERIQRKSKYMERLIMNVNWKTQHSKDATFLQIYIQIYHNFSKIDAR